MATITFRHFLAIRSGLSASQLPICCYVNVRPPMPFFHMSLPTVFMCSAFYSQLSSASYFRTVPSYLIWCPRVNCVDMIFKACLQSKGLRTTCFGAFEWTGVPSDMLTIWLGQHQLRLRPLEKHTLTASGCGETPGNSGTGTGLEEPKSAEYRSWFVVDC